MFLVVHLPEFAAALTRLPRRGMCPGGRQHLKLIGNCAGGVRTAAAKPYPPKLCQAMASTM
eukprot:12903936-Prorocentrum_lima.AAC.1